MGYPPGGLVGWAQENDSMRMIWAGAVLGVVSGLGLAGMEAQAGTAGAAVAPASAYDASLTLFEKECVAVAKAMPADKYDFSPASLKIPGAKFEGVRTFAGEVTHLTQANYYFYGVAGAMKPDVDVKAIGGLKTKDEIVAALEASFVFAHKAIATLNAGNAFEAIKPVDEQTTRGTLAGFGVSHGFDHYGQMVEYLRMNGILPPGSK